MMFGLILSFFGLNPYGFKRKNVFFNFCTKFFHNKNIKYLGGIFFSSAIFICDCCDSSYTKSFKQSISPYFLTAKNFANKITQISKTASEYINLKNENTLLKKEIDNLKINISTIKNHAKELNNLKKEVNLKYTFNNYKQIEKILGFDKSAYDPFLLVSSTHKNAEKGMVVISSDGLVGIVFDSNANVSRVLTIADTKIFIPVKSSSGEHFIMSGNGKNKMVSKETRQNNTKTNLAIGDVLFTSGEGGYFPSDIPVAKVVGIENNGETIFCVPLANLDSTAFVWLIEPILNQNQSKIESQQTNT